MIVSGRFNRFYHTVIKDFHSKALQARLYYKTEDELKQDLKDLNKDYPYQKHHRITDGRELNLKLKKKSTSHLTDKELVQHVEFITQLAGENGITLEYAEREWNRLLYEAGIR